MPKKLSMDSINPTSLISAFSKNKLSADIISCVDSWINLPPKLKIPIMIIIIADILKGFGRFFLFSHLINGKNNNAINIDEINGIKIKDSILSK